MSFRETICNLFFVFVLALAAPAQQGKNWGNVPPPSPAVQRGQKLFISNCSFCHAADASGKTGPDLLRSPLVNHDEEGKQIGVVIRSGRGNGKMPPFPTLTDTEISDIAAFLHYQVNSVVARFSYKIQGLMTGDPKAGEAHFQWSRQVQHVSLARPAIWQASPRRRSRQDLEHLFIAGEDDDHPVPVPVTVTLPSGQTVSGTLEHLDEFNVSLRDSDGRYYSWSRDGVKVEVRDPLAAHHELLHKLTDADIHNLLAYLETLK